MNRCIPNWPKDRAHTICIKQYHKKYWCSLLLKFLIVVHCRAQWRWRPNDLLRCSKRKMIGFGFDAVLPEKEHVCIMCSNELCSLDFECKRTRWASARESSNENMSCFPISFLLSLFLVAHPIMGFSLSFCVLCADCCVLFVCDKIVYFATHIAFFFAPLATPDCVGASMSLLLFHSSNLYIYS